MRDGSGAHKLLAAADVSLWKLANGHALASLPVRDLLRVCVEQQRQIDELRDALVGLTEGKGGDDDAVAGGAGDQARERSQNHEEQG